MRGEDAGLIGAAFAAIVMIGAVMAWIAFMDPLGPEPTACTVIEERTTIAGETAWLVDCGVPVNGLQIMELREDTAAGAAS